MAQNVKIYDTILLDEAGGGGCSDEERVRVRCVGVSLVFDRRIREIDFPRDVGDGVIDKLLAVEEIVLDIVKIPVSSTTDRTITSSRESDK